MDNEEETQENELKNSGLKGLALIIGAVWLCVFIIVGAVFFLGDKTSSTNTADLSQPSDQLKQAEEQLKSDPNNLDLLMSLGHLYLDTGRPGEAKPVFEKVLSLDPNNLDAKVDIVIGNMKLGQTNGQLEKLDDVLRVDADYDYALYVKANFLSTISKDFQGALDILRSLEETVTDQGKLNTVKSLIIQAEQGLSGDTAAP